MGRFAGLALLLGVASCAAITGLDELTIVPDASRAAPEAGVIAPVIDASAEAESADAAPPPVAAVCGDGFVGPGEQCDDGNTQSGDGCSATCQIEPGSHCTVTAVPIGATFTIPITYRDMRFAGTPHGHPDFNPVAQRFEQGLVEAALDAQGKPVLLQPGATCTTPENFCWWYHDTDCAGAGSPNPYSQLVTTDSVGSAMVLTLAASGNSLQYTNTAFFPINGLGWDATLGVQSDGTCVAALDGDNFSFTSELHQSFLYRGGERIDFSGDDDVWVFVNGHLAIDIGGIHAALPGSVVLADQPMNRCVNAICDSVAMSDLGLTVGSAYDLAVFQAERHVCGSDYTMKLTGVTPSRTTCTQE